MKDLDQSIYQKNIESTNATLGATSTKIPVGEFLNSFDASIIFDLKIHVISTLNIPEQSSL